MKKTIRTMISATIIIGLMIPVSAGAASKANFYSNDQFSNVTITNSNEEKVVFPTSEDLHNDSVVEGNMAHKIYWSDGGEGTDEYGSMDRVEVDDSDEFVITPTKSEWQHFSSRLINEGLGIELNSNFHKKAYAYGSYIHSVGFIKNGIWIKSSNWINGDFDIGLYMPSQKDRINLRDCAFPSSGKKVILKDEDGVAKLIGATGRNTFYADNGIGKSRYYLYGGTTVLKKEKDGSVSAKPGVKISEKVSKTVTNLYLRPTNKGKNMFLTWNRVKGANRYFVYQYDRVKNEYVRVEERYFQSGNFYNIPMAEVKNDRGYKFYVKAVKWNWYTGKVDKVIDKSYAVWAVSAGNAKGNVSEITTNYKKLKKKMGQKVKLTATVKTKDGKKPISKTIRWFTSNKKIVKLNKTTGQCIFKKKGKCYIWAKAHNGKNSKKITVVVK